MKNVTLAIEDEVLDRARAYAVKRGTTLNAIVRQHLESLGQNEERVAEAMRELRAMSETTSARLGPSYRFDREGIYAEHVLPRHERPDLCGDGET
ncbi:hypothetical protein Sa4125_43500 [Aureimonas sp. SA4125]|uniref:DUF6364 family protein n=1 Tax=Aureimonas sp. SA4125 TaxID=2826993 RepID=UPI001CC5E59B|nr:DUF6364 family protein [Aureimonas sp. SA4125]BDA86808.1 hypothetical protein Sa4125_43500 [Aureimonas sp. SA4125]